MPRRGKSRKLPKTVTIDGEVWTVERPAVLKHPDDGRPMYGFCVYDRCALQVVKHLGDGERAWSTLRHEYCHAHLFKSGIVRMLEVQVKDDAVREYIEDQLIDGGILPIAWNLQGAFAKLAHNG